MKSKVTFCHVADIPTVVANARRAGWRVRGTTTLGAGRVRVTFERLKVRRLGSFQLLDGR